MIKVFMTPNPHRVKSPTNGIEQVIIHYDKYMPKFGFEYVDDLEKADLIANHAGAGVIVDGLPLIAHVHGVYWTADYPDVPQWQFKANKNVVESIRLASQVTVPSQWVAETFKRDMRFSPHVIGHGIDVEQWQPTKEHQNYVLWNKNRTGDVCFVEPLGQLAQIFPKTLFASTFLPENTTPNIKELGIIPHSDMKEWIQGAMVYLSTTKETFGIGILEALASGVPVLGYDFGGNSEIVQHGINGYLAQPDNLEDLAQGFNFCIQNRAELGANAIEHARNFSWQAVCEQVANVYNLAMEIQIPNVSIVIPIYNKQPHEIRRAIDSATKQIYTGIEKIVVVDDGSTNENKVRQIFNEFNDERLYFIRQSNQGVAIARNNGIRETSTKYILCLDADDELYPDAVSKLIPSLESDPSLGIAYGSLDMRLPDDSREKSRWPPDCDFNLQLAGKNQVPTCNLFRREMFDRLGGYKTRYAPIGCGAEDAEFWLRAGAYGWGIKKVTDDSVFLYSLGGATMRDDYIEPDWTVWHPWCSDSMHPFASIATPNHFSHAVRQYDNPSVSIIIPVGPGHIENVINAIDSVEAQTYRNWELVLVNDTGTIFKDWIDAYPYIKLWNVENAPLGAGHARNWGADLSKGDFLVFLDADDWLYPTFLEECITTWNEQQGIVYTDYTGRAIISAEHAQMLQDQDRLYAYDEKSGLAVIGHRSADYNCELAQQQPQYTNDPNMPFYHWCIVSCFVPKIWHNEIGGYDESMPSWEDIDYHWRMARQGKCYTRVEKELVVYNFHTGQRRENSHEIVTEIIGYLEQKYGKDNIMPCAGCGKKVNRVTAKTSQTFSAYTRTKRQLLQEREQDENFVWCTYIGNPANRSDHAIVGPITKTRYAYGHYGQRVLVHLSDIFDSQQRRIGPFEIEQKKPEPVTAINPIQMLSTQVRQEKQIPTKPSVQFDEIKKRAQQIKVLDQPSVQEALPKKEEKETIEKLIQEEQVDLQTIPGITAGIARQLQERDITNVDAILDFGIEGLQGLKRCDGEKAALIIAAIEDRFLS